MIMARTRAATTPTPTGVVQGFPERYLLNRVSEEQVYSGHPELTIDIAKAARLTLLGMVQSTCPIDGYIALVPA